MNKKGQAFLEFFMTYGWAFLVIIIMIGALAYFRVLSPDSTKDDKVCVKTCEQAMNDIRTATTPGEAIYYEKYYDANCYRGGSSYCLEWRENNAPRIINIRIESSRFVPPLCPEGTTYVAVPCKTEGSLKCYFCFSQSDCDDKLDCYWRPTFQEIDG